MREKNYWKPENVAFVLSGELPHIFKHDQAKAENKDHTVTLEMSNGDKFKIIVVPIADQKIGPKPKTEVEMPKTEIEVEEDE